jgi:nucleoside 2-deoxyribosyltransferase
MKLYVAGPMRGMPQYNRAAFEANAYVLRQAGYDVVTPIEVDRRVDPAFDHAIHVATPKQIARFQAESMAELARCDGVALLPGWRGSVGTMQEIDLACSLRIPCGELPVWLWVAAKTGHRDAVRQAAEIIRRYVKETPVGSQPPMIVGAARAWLAKNGKAR